MNKPAPAIPAKPTGVMTRKTWEGYAFGGVAELLNKDKKDVAQWLSNYVFKETVFSSLGAILTRHIAKDGRSDLACLLYLWCNNRCDHDKNMVHNLLNLVSRSPHGEWLYSLITVMELEPGQ